MFSIMYRIINMGFLIHIFKFLFSKILKVGKGNYLLACFLLANYVTTPSPKDFCDGMRVVHDLKLYILTFEPMHAYLEIKSKYITYLFT